MRLVTLFKLIIGINLIFIFVILFQLHSIAKFERHLVNQNNNIEQLNKLTHQIRMSSELLTKFVRAYVATGDTRYIDYFNFVLAVRQGKVAPPKDYTENFWPEVLGNKRALPKTEEKGEFFARQLKKLGIAQNELSKVKTAVIHSDSLALYEKEVMMAKMNHPDSDNGELIKRLYSEYYFQKKVEIMTPINQVLTKLEQQNADVLFYLKQQSEGSKYRFFTLVACIFFSNIVLLILLYKQHVQPFSLVKRMMANIDNPEFKKPSTASFTPFFDGLVDEIDLIKRKLFIQKQSELTHRASLESALALISNYLNSDQLSAQTNIEFWLHLKKSAVNCLGAFGVIDISIRKLPGTSNNVLEKLSENQEADSSDELTFSMSHITLLFDSTEHKQEFDLDRQLIAVAINSLAKAALKEINLRKFTSNRSLKNLDFPRVVTKFPSIKPNA